MYWRTEETVPFRDLVIFHCTGPYTLLCLSPEVLYCLADARYEDSNMYLCIYTLTLIPLRRQYKGRLSSSHECFRNCISQVLMANVFQAFILLVYVGGAYWAFLMIKLFIRNNMWINFELLSCDIYKVHPSDKSASTVTESTSQNMAFLLFFVCFLSRLD